MTKVLVLGAGFGGLEFSSRLSDALDGDTDVTLIDRNDAFVFGFTKLDMMFGHTTPQAIRLEYKDLAKPGVRFVQETITAIDPEARRVTTDGGTYEADVILVALGADLDVAATPGLAEFGHEFYSVPGAEELRGVLPSFARGDVVIGACGEPLKCPPAASEAALMLDESVRARGARADTTITVVSPFPRPVPPSADLSQALLGRFADLDIRFIGQHHLTEVRADAVVLDDGQELPCDLLLGIPVHRVPTVVQESGLADDDGWVWVDQATLATRFADVYAVGDVTKVGTAKAGSFSEAAAAVVADQLIARLRGEPEPPGFNGIGSCYVEFGDGLVSRVDVDFFKVPGTPQGVFHPASAEITAEKKAFSSTRRARWLG